MRSAHLFLASLCVLALFACTPEGERGDRGVAIPTPTPVAGGTMHLGIVGEPATLDPYAAGASDQSFALVRPVFPMPFRLLPDGTTEPDLAARLVVRGRSARLVLRESAWSNGDPITARDVAASIRRADRPSGFARIESARVISERVIRLHGGISNWEETLASGAYVLPGGRLRGGALSGGPFRFSDYRAGRRVVYEPNDDWDGPEPLLDKLVVDFVQSTELLIRLLEQGSVDAAAIPSTVNLDDRLEERGLAHDGALGWESLHVQFAAPAPEDWLPSADLIEREALVEAFVRDEGRFSNSLAPGPLGTEGFWSHVARERGQSPAELTLGAPEGDELLGMMQRAIQLQMESAGVTVEIVTAPWATYYSSWLTGGPADAYLVRSAGAPGAATLSDSVASSAMPLAHVETFLAWRDGVHGLQVNPSLDGPLWNAELWWKGPSI